MILTAVWFLLDMILPPTRTKPSPNHIRIKDSLKFSGRNYKADFFSNSLPTMSARIAAKKDVPFCRDASYDISLLPSVLLTLIRPLPLIRPLRAFYPDLPLTKGCYNNHATFYTCGGYTCSGFTIGFTFTGRSRISKGCLRMLLVFAFLSARDRTLGLRYTVHIM